MADSKEGRGWHGDSAGHAKAGKKGGEIAQQSGRAHKLSDQERSQGGSKSSGNFKNDPKRAAEAGRIGGKK